MSDVLFPSNPELETVPVKAEHLTEGMIIHYLAGAGIRTSRTVNQTFRHRNIYGEDEVQIEFTEGPDMWRTVAETVEVEA